MTKIKAIRNGALTIILTFLVSLSCGLTSFAQCGIITSSATFTGGNITCSQLHVQGSGTVVTFNGVNFTLNTNSLDINLGSKVIFNNCTVSLNNGVWCAGTLEIKNGSHITTTNSGIGVDGTAGKMLIENSTCETPGITVRYLCEADIQNSTIKIEDNGLIIVSAYPWYPGGPNYHGGVLKVSNSLITTKSTSGGAHWKGISVEGMNSGNLNIKNQPQTYSAKAILTNSTIERAEWGIMNCEAPDPMNYLATPGVRTGGIIQAYQTIFKNNITGVLMKTQESFLNSSNNILVKDKSYFHLCDFICDAPASNFPNGATNITRTFIDLINVEGVDFRGCDFVDNSEGQIMGAGIRALNAGFSVRDYCTGPYTAILMPCTGGTPSTFTGFASGGYEWAIEATNHNTKLHALSISKAVFTDNANNISITSYLAPSVTNNTITANNNLLDPSGDYKFVGIVMKGCPGMSLQGNNISISNYNGSTVRPAVGIGIINAGSKPNEVYMNTLTNMDYALQCIGQNREPVWGKYGLKLLCNTMSCNNNKSTDIFVAPEEFPGYTPIYANTGIASDQRQILGISGKSAGNKFAIKNGIVSGPRHYNNAVGALATNHGIYYYYLNGGTNEYPFYDNLVASGGNKYSTSNAATCSVEPYQSRSYDGTAKPVVTSVDATSLDPYARYIDPLMVEYMCRDTIMNVDTMEIMLSGTEYLFDYKIMQATVLSGQDLYDDAIDLLNNLSTEFELTEEEINWVNNISAIFGVAKSLHENDYDWSAVSQPLKDQLAEIAEIDGYYAKFMARGFLAQYEGAVYGPDLVWEEDSLEEKPGNLSIASLDEEVKNVYPNPVQNDLSIFIDNSNTATDMTLTDITGKVLMQSELKQGVNKFNVNKLNPGMYFVNMYVDGKRIGVVKVVKE